MSRAAYDSLIMQELTDEAGKMVRAAKESKGLLNTIWYNYRRVPALAFAKQLMTEAGIPTAQHRTFRNAQAALAYLEDHGAPVVVKADGNAATALGCLRSRRRTTGGPAGRAPL